MTSKLASVVLSKFLDSESLSKFAAMVRMLPIVKLLGLSGTGALLVVAKLAI